MNRRKLLGFLLGLPLVAAVLPKSLLGYVSTPKMARDPDTLFLACSLILTRREMEQAASGDLLKAKIENLKRSFADLAIEEMDKRGWRHHVEYAENTTAK